MLRRTTTVLSRALIGVLICRAGRVREEMMGTLIFVCPATGEEVSTGLEMDLPTLGRLELGKVYCPHCRQPHQMAGLRYWLTEVYLLETGPVKPVKAA
jgi:hypothetical protein